MRRVIAAVAAIVLAVVGAVLVATYVRRADERALEGLEPTDVLVVSEPIAAGTPAESLLELVELATLPASAVPEGAIDDLSQLAGRVTTVPLLPGEQLVAGRFVDPTELADPLRVDPPEGFQELTIQLDAQRVLGGTLVAGDLVGVVLSGTLENQAEGQSADITTFILDQVLVTHVALTAPTTEEDGERAPQSLYVTFAVDTTQAEQIVFGMEHANVWLTLQPEGALAGTSQVVTPEIMLR